jgi:16S rRNA (cytosine1402-N4)-methyltransferase
VPTPDPPTPAYHVPVLGEQVRALLVPGGTPDGGPVHLHPVNPHPFKGIDMTLGGGGHTALLLAATAPEGRVLGLDRDPAALAAAERALIPFAGRFALARAAFDAVDRVAAEHGFAPADAVLMDLGVSSRQLDDPARGFSFRADGPLDMRMDPDGPVTAADLVARLSEADLARLFKDLGEERHARRIARAVVRARAEAPIATTARLAEVVANAVPAKERHTARIHPATRVFQALRMAVNDEAGQLARGLEAAFTVLGPGGRMAVISFHSLEDRAVKRFFKDLSTGCVCPPAFPVCRCGRVPRARLLTRRAQRPAAAEVAANPRARSARLRAVEKISADKISVAADTATRRRAA